MTRHLCIRIGDWMLMNWHLYRLVPCASANGTTRWIGWQCVFCNRFEHENRPALGEGER